LDEVFTLHYLPGRIFLFAPAETIGSLSNLVGFLSKPSPVPRSEWDTPFPSPLFLPWSCRHINVQSFIKIAQKGAPYDGNLAYVVGSAKTTDALVIAVVPHILRNDGRTVQKLPLRSKGAALFQPDNMTARIGSKALTTLSVNDENNFVTILENQLVKPMATSPLDMAEFNWAELSIIKGESVHQFGGQLFFRGLLLFSLFAFGAVDTVHMPPIDEIIPFAQSSIDPHRIDKILSQLHWRAGDHVSHGDNIYQLGDIQLDNGSVVASPLRSQLDEDPPMLQLPINELERRFSIGDEVVVLAGAHKGIAGSVVAVEDQRLKLLTDDVGTHVRTSINCVGCTVILTVFLLDFRPLPVGRDLPYSLN
jgi:hypothetical protein